MKKLFNPLKVGSFAGVPVKIHITWLWLFVLISQYTLVTESYEGYFWTRVGVAIAIVLGFSFSLLFHEFSHVIAARGFGIETHDIVLHGLGGIARIKEDLKDPLTELIVAVAGPFSSAFLCVAFGLAFFVTALSDLSSDHPMGFMLMHFGMVNMALTIFNLIPCYPMDGGRIFRAILWITSESQIIASYRAARLSMVLCVLLAILGVQWGMIGLFLVSIVIGFIAFVTWRINRSFALQEIFLQKRLKDLVRDSHLSPKDHRVLRDVLADASKQNSAKLAG